MILGFLLCFNLAHELYEASIIECCIGFCGGMPIVGFAAGLADPELGPPGGSRFGSAFVFGDCPTRFFE